MPEQTSSHGHNAHASVALYPSANRQRATLPVMPCASSASTCLFGGSRDLNMSACPCL